MKILIYGAGVQGSFLAHVLSSKKTNEVTILARGQRADYLKENGIVINHYFQRKTTRDKIRVVTSLEKTDFYDLIFVTMNYTDFPSVLSVLAQNISQNIILVGNNLTPQAMHDEIMRQSSTKKNIIFGFQSTGGKREENQTICIRFGKGDMLLGALDGDISFKNLIDEAFLPKQYQVKYETKIEDWLKSHAVLVMMMNALTLIHDSDFEKVTKDTVLLKKSVNAVNEGFSLLEALDYEPLPKSLYKFFKNHKGLAASFLKFYHRLPLAKVITGSSNEIFGLFIAFHSFKIGHEANLPNFNEIESLLLLKKQTS